ncbi:hypothetical protein CNMCM8927_003767 [Aspergillus lentulus]|uniref:NmrA-like domain-containing protein n=1 Tax=Aspergillus lentulus TaxID=293939 RepID=A0AAN5YWW7_ASPLE|nr:hypothetical protein CNMCM6069_003710 [Aspergillus lentulus]KAF4178892.1 hypothetical protein CNMCM8060_004001 [Aspergillus lentulus]KAF4187525.1 hypothetical protein CNMCM7927_003998 [Aspergillus lentulus]KAF4196674.1 hypothetical protein CNMCM8694_004622 [Aspergillus lentulus]KAF4207196.1 hypothetical protein CNMCM8927_003767 [Aspergillus lentulus]
MAQTIKNVALAGATGNAGSNILTALLDTGKFTITVLTRNPNPNLPASVTTQVVDFDSFDSITAALKGQDAFIDATSVPDPSVAIRLIDAAVAAGVHRFIPAEFSIDPTATTCRALPVFAGKARVYEYLRQVAADGRITYTSISTGAFLDWTLRTGFLNIDIGKKRIDLLNDGSRVVPWTLLSSVGKAVANALLRAEETKNRTCYVCSIMKSQREVGELAQDALGKEGWSVQSQNPAKALEDAMAQFKVGNVTVEVIGAMIRWTLTQPESAAGWAKNDNELLGVPTMTDEEVKQLIKQIAEEMKA